MKFEIWSVNYIHDVTGMTSIHDVYFFSSLEHKIHTLKKH